MRTRRVKRPSLRAQALALLLTAVLTSAALAAPQIWGYQEGLAKAAEGGLWGFANVAGEIVIPIQYQSVMDFSLGVARVQKNNKHAGATTNTLPDSKWLFLSVRGTRGPMGIVGIPISGYPVPDAFEKNLMIAILGECGLSQERIRVESEQTWGMDRSQE